MIRSDPNRMNRQPLLTGATDAKRQLARRLRQSQTESERRLWRELRANRLAGIHFRRQQPLHGFIVDFYCHGARLAIEVDGAVHDSQKEYDRERDAILHFHGIQTLRFPNDRVESDLPAVLNEIRTACLGRIAASSADSRSEAQGE